ncbi:MAG: protein kinase, partial [Candidatus Eisenbacteria bacterium]|nr:protein kinase [Candidatus Eisenbacteria bacterium]
MTLTPGTRVGPYEILGPLGAGGMGLVYRAQDPRLERQVAIKALPEAMSGDAERLARFEREARVLASLNHPNIAAIYGLETLEGVPHLVLELVDGETLSARLARGAMAPVVALDIGMQVAAAIEAAHDGGIVHRDLKPGNVMITGAGMVKVLDFGLAKGAAAVSSASSPDLSASPTMALSATREGMILGTAPYMSPEQARGQAVDRRTDVWAFGCLLYECLSGRPTFSGDTVSDVVARILEREPDWGLLPAALPPRILDIVRRCLTKEMAQRPRAIGDLRLELGAIRLEMSSPTMARPATASARPSLAVLYFENLSSDSESDYFCAGITEDILTDLSKIKGLNVASRNAVARYRGKTVDPAQVGAELSVTAVLEGSVRRAGDRVRISAQLINAADGFHLWADRYDRTMEDVFAVQEEIAASITEALRVALTPAEAEALIGNRPDDVRAYDLYLRGRDQYGRYQADSLKEAVELFEQAIAIDPNYALAWAGLADACAQTMHWGYASDPAAMLNKGLAAARKAINLNPSLAEGHKAEALNLRGLNDVEGEIRSLGQAIEANPRYLPAIINLAVVAFESGNVAGAERGHRRALEIDPQEAFATTWLMGITHMTGRPDETLALAERLLEISDKPFYMTASYMTQAILANRQGDPAAAGALLVRAAAAGADASNMRSVEAMLHAASGRPAEALELLREMAPHSGLNTGTLLLAARISMQLGEPEMALSFFERPIVGHLVPTMLRLHPEFHP